MSKHISSNVYQFSQICTLIKKNKVLQGIPLEIRAKRCRKWSSRATFTGVFIKRYKIRTTHRRNSKLKVCPLTRYAHDIQSIKVIKAIKKQEFVCTIQRRTCVTIQANPLVGLRNAPGCLRIVPLEDVPRNLGYHFTWCKRAILCHQVNQLKYTGWDIQGGKKGIAAG